MNFIIEVLSVNCDVKYIPFFFIIYDRIILTALYLELQCIFGKVKDIIAFRFKIRVSKQYLSLSYQCFAVFYILIF